MKENMLLWEQVQKTELKYTKPVKFGRGFTAIDPHSQVMKATEAFGPAGNGWGWKVMRVDYTPTNDVAILVGLWVDDHHSRDDHYECPGIQQWGQASLYIDAAESKKDNDAFKKATTDGLTKCLSYLGFNADVFLGLFDDNKYVQQLKKEEANGPSPDQYKAAQAKYDRILKNIQACDSLESINKLREKVKPEFNKIKDVDTVLAKQLYSELQKKLSEFPDTNP